MAALRELEHWDIPCCSWWPQYFGQSAVESLTASWCWELHGYRKVATGHLQTFSSPDSKCCIPSIPLKHLVLLHWPLLNALVQLYFTQRWGKRNKCLSQSAGSIAGNRNSKMLNVPAAQVSPDSCLACSSRTLPVCCPQFRIIWEFEAAQVSGQTPEEFTPSATTFRAWKSWACWVFWPSSVVCPCRCKFTAWVQECCGRPCWEPCWAGERQQPLVFPHLWFGYFTSGESLDPA